MSGNSGLLPVINGDDEFLGLVTMDAMLELCEEWADGASQSVGSIMTRALITAKMIAVSALLRKESRGGHYRTDFPDEIPELAQRSFLTWSAACKTADDLVNGHQSDALES